MLSSNDSIDWTGWSRYPYCEDPIPGRTYLVRIYSRRGLAGDEIVEGVQLYVGGANWEGGLGLDQVLGWKLIEEIPARPATARE
jgi:hypothetical protein